MAMLGNQTREGTMQTYSHVATAGQTSFPCSYGVGSSSVSVFQNGVLLSGSDINLTSGNAAVLTVAAAVNDEITIQVQDVFSVADTVSAASGGTFTGNVQFDGSFTSKGIDDNADATAITIDSSENVLIGHTDPFSPISNGGSGVSAMANGQLFTGHAGTAFYANREDSDGDIAVFRKDGASVGTIGSAGSGTELYVAGSGANTSGIYFNGVNQAIPMKAGSLSDATQDLGKTNFRWKDLYLSGGAYLGGTGAANKLSDYEEGTFTPTLKKGSLTSFTYVSQIGKYTKIGNVYKISFYIFCNNTGTTNNGATWEITGLPFNISHLNNCGYQFIPNGYTMIAGVDRFTNSHRWQANTTTALSLYGTNGSTEHTGSNLEFSGSGILTTA